MSWDSWKKRQFHIRFQKAEEGGYIVSIPEMPGCVTQAESFGEGVEMIRDVLEGLLQVAVEHGDSIPEQFRDLVDELMSYSLSGKQTARPHAR
jgi:antitoxin HicB